MDRTRPTGRRLVEATKRSPPHLGKQYHLTNRQDIDLERIHRNPEAERDKVANIMVSSPSLFMEQINGKEQKFRGRRPPPGTEHESPHVSGKSHPHLVKGATPPQSPNSTLSPHHGHEEWNAAQVSRFESGPGLVDHLTVEPTFKRERFHAGGGGAKDDTDETMMGFKNFSTEPTKILRKAFCTQSKLNAHDPMGLKRSESTEPQLSHKRAAIPLIFPYGCN